MRISQSRRTYLAVSKQSLTVYARDFAMRDILASQTCVNRREYMQQVLVDGVTGNASINAADLSG